MFSRRPISLRPQKYALSPWSLGRKRSGKEGQGGFAVHDALSARRVAICPSILPADLLGSLSRARPTASTSTGNAVQVCPTLAHLLEGSPPPLRHTWMMVCKSHVGCCSPACNLHWAALSPTL